MFWLYIDVTKKIVSSPVKRRVHDFKYPKPFTCKQADDSLQCTQGAHLTSVLTNLNLHAQTRNGVVSETMT